MVDNDELTFLLERIYTLIPSSEILDLEENIDRRGTPVHNLRVANNGIEYTLTTELYQPGHVLQERTRLRGEVTAERLGLNPMKPKEEPSGFRVFGVNETALIRTLHSINGQPIEELETAMKPYEESQAGFLGPDESLLDVMAQDNDFVLLQGLTHQDLALPLLIVKELLERGLGNEFTYRGSRFSLKGASYRGMQYSPFKDGTGTNSDVAIINLETGKSLRCSLLLANLIERYGFYEGKGTSYRLDPAQIIEVFDYLKALGQEHLEARRQS